MSNHTNNFWLFCIFCAILFGAASCKHRTEKLLVGKWRSVKVENRDKDNFFRSSKEFIDTMGRGNSDSVNMETYGVTNIDSLRRELQAQFDSAYAAQMTIDTSSIFVFGADSSVTFSFPGKSETGKWYMDTRGMLVLDETNEMGQTEQLKIEVSYIDQKEMRLTFIRDLEEGLSDTSVVSFVRLK